MDRLEARNEQLCPETATMRFILEVGKTPSVRNLNGKNSGYLRANAPASRISFKWGQKMLRKWFAQISETPEPLLTQ